MNFSTVLMWYTYILPPFVLQLAVAEGIFCCRLKRRPWFLFRLAAGVLIFAGTLLFAAYAILLLIEIHGALITPVYLAIFLLTVCVMKMCFDESFSVLLFYGIAAYAIQNLGYRAYSILELYGVVWRLAEKIGYWPAYLLLWNGVFAAAAAVVFVLLIRRMLQRDAARLSNVKVYALSFITLAITVLLCSWTNAYAWESGTLTMIIYLFSCVCCIFILCLQSGMLQTEGLRQDLEVVKQLWEQDRKQYEISRENIEIINIKCHDLRFRIQALRTSEGAIPKEELEEIENAISIYDSQITTGCEPLDTILTEKSLLCNKDGIRLTCMVDGSKLSFITHEDIYSLFGNIISNAVEAVQKVEDREYRLITFSVMQVGNMLLVSTENYFSGQLEFRAGLPATSKQDTVNHGYGMKSIQMLVKKYGGDMSVDAKDNIFTLKLLFPLAS